MSGKETKDSKGRKKERKKERKKGRKGKKETVSRGRRPAAEGAETDAVTDARTVRTQKNPEVSLPQGLC
ncbi:hypothetical protein BACPLE_00565 [Phocaeicola plebeius DSM 17135]|uniref:Uncharacterized protein n=1 Tax=Phocaeicola plebeius (strain DSM 17135 / JCM 12973 / CCUG 54634 / M2) TaxID=484018 RepID=B5CV36_PHOPM|nr:hypothetical protein BACPLE_00565 [Phocaeicola plebeius DSM 17135]